MSRPSRAAVELIDEAREQISKCMEPPKPRGDAWVEAGRDVRSAARTVGRGMRSAMNSVDSELAAQDG